MNSISCNNNIYDTYNRISHNSLGLNDSSIANETLRINIHNYENRNKERKERRKIKGIDWLMITIITILLLCILGYSVIHLYYKNKKANTEQKVSH